MKLFKNRGKYKKLNSDDKFKYDVLFRDFPILPLTLYIIVLLFNTLTLFLFAIYFNFITTDNVDKYCEQLLGFFKIMETFLIIISLNIFINYLLWVYNIYNYFKKRKEFFKERGI